MTRAQASALEPLLADGVIDEILGRLKTGKEAEVWLVRHREDVLAAKVYKERHVRSFKHSAGYKEGRAVRNTRTQRAMDRGSRFGQEAAEDAWKAAESDALHKLHAAGVRVPTPVLYYDGILLMELVLGEDGQPAPRLIDAPLAREAALPLYEDLRGQAVKMLACDLIHGDLSPYNILLGTRGPTVIDFPQVVAAAHNSLAEGYFVRDLENVRRHFAAIDPALEGRAGDAAEIWSAYVRRDLAPDFVPSGRPPPAPRAHGGARGNGQRPARGPGEHGAAAPHPHRPRQAPPSTAGNAPRAPHPQHRPAHAHDGRPQHAQHQQRPAHPQHRPRAVHPEPRPQPPQQRPPNPRPAQAHDARQQRRGPPPRAEPAARPHPPAAREGHPPAPRAPHPARQQQARPHQPRAPQPPHRPGPRPPQAPLVERVQRTPGLSPPSSGVPSVAAPRPAAAPDASSPPEPPAAPPSAGTRGGEDGRLRDNALEGPAPAAFVDSAKGGPLETKPSIDLIQ